MTNTTTGPQTKKEPTSSEAARSTLTTQDSAAPTHKETETHKFPTPKEIKTHKSPTHKRLKTHKTHKRVTRNRTLIPQLFLLRRTKTKRLSLRTTAHLQKRSLRSNTISVTAVRSPGTASPPTPATRLNRRRYDTLKTYNKPSTTPCLFLQLLSPTSRSQQRPPTL